MGGRGSTVLSTKASLHGITLGFVRGGKGSTAGPRHPWGRAHLPHASPPVPAGKRDSGTRRVQRSFAALQCKPEEIAYNAQPQENQRLERLDSNSGHGVGVAGPLITPKYCPVTFPTHLCTLEPMKLP